MPDRPSSRPRAPPACLQLAALRQLQEYEQAMEAGEEAEAAAGEEGAAGVPPALRKTRSQQADALLAHNLADLAHEYEGGGREAAPGTGAAAEPAGAEE